MRPWAVAVLVTVAWILILPLGIYLYLAKGHVPVAVNDPAFPYEEQIVHVPLNARIDREAPHSSPVPVSDASLTDGARIYKQECAFCHGVPDHPSEIGSHMYPAAPQLWKKHRNSSVVGVSDDPVGDSFWRVKNGIRLCGMPSYEKTLSETEMWEVSDLVSVADKPLPQTAQAYLKP